MADAVIAIDDVLRRIICRLSEMSADALGRLAMVNGRMELTLDTVDEAVWRRLATKYPALPELMACNAPFWTWRRMYRKWRLLGKCACHPCTLRVRGAGRGGWVKG